MMVRPQADNWREAATDDRMASFLSEVLSRIPAYHLGRSRGFLEDVREATSHERFLFRNALQFGGAHEEALFSYLQDVATRRYSDGVPLDALLQAYSIGYERWWKRYTDAVNRSDPASVEQMLYAGARMIGLLPQVFLHLSTAFARSEARTHQPTLAGFAVSDGRRHARHRQFDDNRQIWGVIATDSALTWNEITSRVPDATGQVIESTEGVLIGLLTADWAFEERLSNVIGGCWPTTGAMVYASPPSETAPDIDRLVEHCSAALRSVQRMGLTHRWLSLDEVAFYDAQTMIPAAVRQQFVCDILGTLSDLRDPSHESLMETLQAFCHAGRSVARTAQIMHVHPNTIVYRFNRMDSLCQRSVRSEGNWPLVRTALAMFDLIPHSEHH